MKLIENISVVGLGKLGLPLLVSIANAGYNCIGYDVNGDVASRLASGTPHISEPGVKELLSKNKKRITLVNNLVEAVKKTEITFIVAPTPSMNNGNFSVKYIRQTIKEIAKGITTKKYHLVVLVSTVLSETCDMLVKELSLLSGKRAGSDFGFCYNPEFIALGNVLDGLINPDLVLVGEYDKKSGDMLETFYKTFAKKGTPIARMNFVNAELCKVSINTFITTKISYANMLAEICERIPGGDIDVVTSAMGLDTRIGKKYFQGGTSFGGPCFPRDNIAFLHLAQKLGVIGNIPNATHEINVRQNARLLKTVKSNLKDGSSLAILGMSYKPNTDVIEESASYYILNELLPKVNIYDPKSIENTKKLVENKVKYYDSLENCIKDSDVILVSTLWPDIIQMDINWLKSKNEKTIIDPWRMLKGKKLPKNVKYIPFGKNSSR